MRRMSILTVLFHCQMVIAAYSYHSFCTNVATEFAIGKATSPALTNSIQNFASRLQGAELTAASVVLSIVQYDFYEQTMDAAFLDSCIDLCTNAMVQPNCPDCDWRKSAACAVLSTALATKCQYLEAFCVCTNALAHDVVLPSTADDIALWNAISSHHLLEGLDVNETLKFYAAMSFLFGGMSPIPPVYTNTLPAEALKKIHEVLEWR